MSGHARSLYLWGQVEMCNKVCTLPDRKELSGYLFLRMLIRVLIFALAYQGTDFCACSGHCAARSNNKTPRSVLVEYLPKTQKPCLCLQGAPIRYLTPDAVVEYIRKHGLYASPTTTE